MAQIATYAAPRRTRGGSKGNSPNLTVRSNLAAWYRYRNNVINTSGLCSQWSDASGNMRHLLQATAANRPTVLSDGSLLFNGTAAYMQATFTLTQPCTIYIALAQISSTVSNIVFDGATGNVRMVQQANNAFHIAAGSQIPDSAAMPVGSNSFIVAACVFNGASSSLQVGGGAAPTTTSGNANTNNPGGITLGSSRVPSVYSNIRVKEMLVYSAAHDTTTQSQVLRYLARLAQVGGV